MINIFFVPGMFGSTIEYVLRYNNTKLDTTKILSDGSMHSYKHQAHLATGQQLADNLHKIYHENSLISTIIYPFSDMSLDQILLQITDVKKCKNILVHAENIVDSELNLLFQYYKILAGTQVHLGNTIFNNPNESKDVKQWNIAYTCTNDMCPWEYREWFSIFYPSWTSEWIDSKSVVNDSFLKISNAQFLHNTLDTMSLIMDYCEYDVVENNVNNFILSWKNSQRYILDKFNVLNEIVDATITNSPYNWQPLSIIEEAIVQQRLRYHGFELQCDGLDIFPSDAINLNRLMYKN